MKPPGEAAARPARQVNIIERGYQLLYTPGELPPDLVKKARVSLILVPADNNTKLTVFPSQPAGQRGMWTAPYRLSTIGVVFAPQGLDEKKVRTLVTKDRELILELADYAEQTAQVENLIDTLSKAEEGRNLDAALTGFASRYGTALPKLDRTAPTDQQAFALMQALNPALSSYDPLAPERSARMQQSAGLAASVAGLFFGTNVGLAAGGAALVQNFRTLLFPGTDFRSALAQTPAGSTTTTLCAKRQPARSRTRLAYLWGLRVPDAGPPSFSLPPAVHVPLGVKSSLPVEVKTAAEWAAVGRAHDWALVSGDGRSVPVDVKQATEGRVLEIDLKAANPAPGLYHLQAKWDWDPFPIAGDVHVHALPDLMKASLTPTARDRLVEGTGVVGAELAGADFEFVEKLTLDQHPLEFKLPQGRRAGPQERLTVSIDTNKFKRGHYRLALYHPDGSAAAVPVRVLPPHPSVAGLPLRANLGEERQKIALHGSDLGRVERIESAGAKIELGEASPDGTARDAFIRLEASAKKGDHFPMALKVEGVEAPLQVPDAIEVAGPRPQIAGLNVSIADDLGVAVHKDELPAGSFASISMRLENVETSPAVHIACAESERTLHAEMLRAGEKRPAARVDAAGPGTLFLSLDPGSIGRSGCTLTAMVETESAGKSDPRTVGRVVRLPRISGFTLTDERVGDNAYAGVLIGYDLETIERAGWDPQSGVPVDSLPRPVAGERDKQTLRLVLPWPAPAPHAPVYIWLRGESEGRVTRAKY